MSRSTSRNRMWCTSATRPATPRATSLTVVWSTALAGGIDPGGAPLLLPLPLDLGIPRALEPLVRLELRPQLLDRPLHLLDWLWRMGSIQVRGLVGTRSLPALPEIRIRCRLQGRLPPRLSPGLPPRRSCGESSGSLWRSAAKQQCLFATRQCGSSGSYPGQGRDPATADGGARPGEQRLHRQER